MRKKIDTLLIGATYFAIGYASKHPGCVIIEKSQMLGCDFHQNARTADISNIDDSAITGELADIMRESGVLVNEKFDILKSVLALHKYVSERKDISVLLDARVLEIKKAEDGYEVKYIDNEGIHFVQCNQILDTTLNRETCPGAVTCEEKTLNIFTVATTDSFEENLLDLCKECKIQDGVNPNEKFVKFPVTAETKMLAAYRMVTDLWKKAFANTGEKILFVAEDFEYTCKESPAKEAPCSWHGVKYADPMTAFAEGTKYSF